MKVAILAGGVGSRLSEETVTKPKPMVEIGGYPILWHIMKHYEVHGFKDFVVALGYKGHFIKRYFVDFVNLDGDLLIDMETGGVRREGGSKPDWRVGLVETGIHTNTAGRIKRLGPHLANETFMLTWGDGVSNVDLQKLVAFHKKHGKLATMTAVRPVARFGHIDLDGDQIHEFSEKPQTREGWINGAFFVLEPQVLDYIDGDDTAWEKAPLENLAKDGQLMAYKHDDFWQCMDTLRDRVYLQKMWDTVDAPWKTWE
jgi:glucose-1-phosphate cytidylyltransferase